MRGLSILVTICRKTAAAAAAAAASSSSSSNFCAAAAMHTKVPKSTKSPRPSTPRQRISHASLRIRIARWVRWRTALSPSDVRTVEPTVEWNWKPRGQSLRNVCNIRRHVRKFGEGLERRAAQARDLRSCCPHVLLISHQGGSATLGRREVRGCVPRTFALHKSGVCEVGSRW